MSQYVALPCVLPNKASRSLALDIIQPAFASLQTGWRPVKLYPPEVNSMLFQMDMITLTCIGEALNGQERNQHIVSLNADIAFVVRRKEAIQSRSPTIRPDGAILRTLGDVALNVGGHFFDMR